MEIKRKLNVPIVLVTSLVLTSGSILNVIGIDEYLISTLFVGVFLWSLKVGVLTRKSFVLVWLMSLFGLTTLFALQAVDEGDLASLFNRNNIKVLLLFSACLIAAYYFTWRRDFVEKMHFVLFAFTLHGALSCLAFSLFPTQNVLFSPVDLKSQYVGYWPLVIQRVNVDYFGSLHLTPVQLLGLNIYRAHGLAWEPGNFASLVNIFIFINLFVRRNTKSVILGVLAVMLAMSSNGFLVLMVQFVAYMATNSRKFFRKHAILKLLLLPILSALLVGLSIDNINEKIYGERSGSGATRFIDTASAMIAIYNNPFIGTGVSFANYSNELSESLEMSRKALSAYVATDRVSGLTFTNSFLALFVQFGVPIALLFTVCLFRQALIPVYKGVFGLVVLLSACSAPLMMTPFFLLFVMSGFLDLLGIKDTA